MKNSNTKYNYDLRLKSSVTSSFRLYFFIACFTFLSLRLLTSLTGSAYANSVADDSRKLSQSSVITSRDPKNKSELELLRAEVSIAKDEKDTKSRDQLKQIIEQIRSVEFGPQKQAPAPVIVPEKAPETEPDETVSDVPLRKQETRQAVVPKPKYSPISEKTLQMLKTLAEDPGKLDNPLELGEILFVSGNLNEAAVFYSEALKRKDPNDVNLSLDRAWILFQTGNCLRNDDRSAAAKAYQQLITEYPNSPWTDLAKARSNLIAWYLRDEPVKLIAEVKRGGSKQDNIR